MKALLVAALLCLAWPLAAQDGAPMTFDRAGTGGNCLGCEWVAAEGVITPETPAAYRAFRGESQGGVTILLNSPGGDLGAALELGRLFREYGDSTAISGTRPLPGGAEWQSETYPGRCESACAFAFFGGRIRSISGGEGFPYSGGSLGMHQFFTRDGALSSAATQAIMGQLLIYLIDMGIDTNVLTIASRVSGGAMHRFSEAEITALSLQTEVHETPMALVAERGGVLLRWEWGSGVKDPYSEGRIYCHVGAPGWFLEVHHPGWVPGAIGFARADGTAIGMDNASIPVAGAQVSEVFETTEGGYLRLTLPFDPVDHAGQRLYFNPGTSTASRNLWRIEGRMPDAATLRVLRRACIP